MILLQQKKNKLSNIAENAQANVIEGIQLNGSQVTPTNKIVNISAVTDDNYVHTDNNYTSDEKIKLNGIDTGAQVNVIEEIEINGTSATISAKKATLTIEAGRIDSISVNGTPQTITNKNVDITVPTNNNQLTNGAGYQTSSDVQSAINNAISGITTFDQKVVTSLPTTGVKGTIYLMSNGGTSPDVYDEYIWIADTSTYEKIGTTKVDLDGYVKKEDLVAITNTEIDNLFA